MDIHLRVTVGRRFVKFETLPAEKGAGRIEIIDNRFKARLYRQMVFLVRKALNW